MEETEQRTIHGTVEYQLCAKKYNGYGWPPPKCPWIVHTLYTLRARRCTIYTQPVEDGNLSS